MRKGLAGLAMLFAVLLIPSSASAQLIVSEDFFVTAEIPQATDIAFIVHEVDGDVFNTLGEVTNLDFELTYNSEFGIYLPEFIYAIDVAPEGGAGVPSVLIEYVDTQNPNGDPASGLGAKTVAAAVRVEGVNETVLVEDTLNGIDGTNIPSQDIQGGFMRFYLGIATGEPGTPGEPFTNGDQPGSYEGTLTLTATIT